MIKIDQKCEVLKKCVLNMASRVEQMHELALETIADGNVNNALKIIEMDEFVNAAEEEINDLAIEALALLSPVASDLRKVISSVKIASDLERIGDYAKNIAVFIIKNNTIDSDLVSKAQDIGNIFLAMLDHAMEAYSKEDAEWAMMIPSEDEQINDLYKEIIDILQSGSVNNKDMKNLIETAGMIRNLERAGDHTKNICEHCIFEVKGQHIEFN